MFRTIEYPSKLKCSECYVVRLGVYFVWLHNMLDFYVFMGFCLFLFITIS